MLEKLKEIVETAEDSEIARKTGAKIVQETFIEHTSLDFTHLRSMYSDIRKSKDLQDRKQLTLILTI